MKGFIFHFFVFFFVTCAFEPIKQNCYGVGFKDGIILDLCKGKHKIEYKWTTNGSANNSDYPELNPEWSYCLEMTWFGPEYSNVTQYNGTCSDYLDETRADGVPCAAPIVISFDGTLPNMDYLWDNYKESILCKRSVTQRCIKYTYFYNNIIANITYMCSKVQHDSGGIVDSGCYKQKLTEGYETEICICKSTNGLHRPCNSAFTITTINIFVLFTLSGLLYTFN